MRIATTVVFALAIVALIGATTASAQTPFIAAYFDEGFTSLQEDCPAAPPGTVLGTLHVVLVNANAFVTGAEYRILYPASIAWLADQDTPPVTLGISPTGIALGYNVPQNGFFPVLLHRVQFLWLCSDCSIPNDPIIVAPSPVNPNGKVQWTDWPGFDLYDAIGLTSQICATVATEETTWGQVKSLYR